MIHVTRHEHVRGNARTGEIRSRLSENAALLSFEERRTLVNKVIKDLGSRLSAQVEFVEVREGDLWFRWTKSRSSS